MIDRRSILRGALFGAGAAAFPKNVVAAMTRAAEYGTGYSPTATGQLLIVFLRGGNDATNTLIPHGDTTYPTARPNLYVPDADRLVLPGVNHTRLNKWLGRLAPVYGNGRLALLHRVGDPAATRSHFLAMDMFETAAEETITVTNLATQQGFVNKILATAGIPNLHNSPALPNGPPLPAALSVSALQQRMFRTSDIGSLAAHAPSLLPADLGLPHPVPSTGMESILYSHAGTHILNPVTATDGLAAANLAFGLDARAGLADLGFQPDFATTGRFPVSNADIASLAQGVGGPPPELPIYQPPGGAFIAALEQAFFALERDPNLRVAGVEFGGWDTHGSQMDDLEHPNLLRYLGWGLRDLDDAIQAAGAGSRITVLVVSEFGRTNRENSGDSTDHGVGGVYFAMGKSVRAGTYNCAPPSNPGTLEFGAPWIPLINTTSPPKYENALEVATDFRDVLAEICHKCFGIPVANLSGVINGYSGSTAQWLNFLR